MFIVGETIVTRGCTYEVLAKGDEVDYQGETHLFVKIVRTEVPYKGRVKYGSIRESWLNEWAKAHPKYDKSGCPSYVGR